MYLKTLTLRGFKSFASATTLEFEPGVTCVVGPNGSGKSNVVDALAWVMGEQGAKTLRGGTMQDVIFAGTSGRPALGRAEVALTIDNSDGALPIEYSEVTISRTLFRAGGSEYAINGSACRLLDVQELLSDTGLGRQMHVIVGQGQLDAVLRATPEERRGFIEEAAGVLKHRRRKEKALRKLESMAANLTRVQDLTAEIRRQLGPLAKQAEVARRASVVQADLRDSRARLLADDLAQLAATVAHDDVGATALAERQHDLESELERQRERVIELEAQAVAAAPAVDQASETWYRLASVRERLRGLETVASERIRLLASATVTTQGPDPAELDRQKERARATEEALQAEIAQVRVALEVAVEARSLAEEQARVAQTETARLHQVAADRREGLARLHGQFEAQRSRYEAGQAEIARLTSEIASTSGQADEADAAYAALEIEVAAAEVGEVNLDDAYEQAQSRLEHVKADADRWQAAASEAEREAETWSQRIETLRLALERKDGAGALLSSPDLPGVVGALAAHVTVTPGYEEAIHAALGRYADGVVVDDHFAAIAALRWLHAHDGGRASLVIEGGVSLGDASDSQSSMAISGTMAARDVVKSAGPLAQVLAHMLADVVIVDSLDHTSEVLATHPQARVVTRQGDLVGGSLAWGGTAAAPSALHLQAELERAEQQKSEAMARCANALAKIPALLEALAGCQATADTALGKLHESDARMASLAESLGSLAEAARVAREHHARLVARLDQLTEQARTHHSELTVLRDRVDAAQSDPQQSPDELLAAATHRDELQQHAARARSVETEARLSLRTLEERFRALAGKVQNLTAAAQRERAARVKAAEAEQRRLAQSDQARAVVAGIAVVIAKLEGSLTLATQRRDSATQAKSQIDSELAQTRDRHEALRKQFAEVTDVAHRQELARAQQQLRLEQMQARAMEELGIDAEVLVEEFGPHRGIPVPDVGESDGLDGSQSERPYVRSEQEKRFRAAERAMALLGRVNPLAMEEHAALEERHAFLAEQLEDLKRSRTDLLQIVREIDDRVERVFAEAFADTEAQFAHVFARLFPGGEGRIVLTDPTDMLTTGVEVEARPAGKKVKRLSLLSGGERSLAAIALLVSIFKARPSPFYVMDEVEAALDDVNLGRLLTIFQELRSDSQLIVITHQKRTMEIADGLYGVTMRGDGVTTVISQRMPERSEA